MRYFIVFFARLNYFVLLADYFVEPAVMINRRKSSRHVTMKKFSAEETPEGVPECDYFFPTTSDEGGDLSDGERTSSILLSDLKPTKANKPKSRRGPGSTLTYLHQTRTSKVCPTCKTDKYKREVYNNTLIQHLLLLIAMLSYISYKHAFLVLLWLQEHFIIYIHGGAFILLTHKNFRDICCTAT